MNIFTNQKSRAIEVLSELLAAIQADAVSVQSIGLEAKDSAVILNLSAAPNQPHV